MLTLQVKIHSMRTPKISLLRVFLLLAVALIVFPSLAQSSPLNRDILDRYRQVIVLFADPVNMTEAEREQADVVGKYLFHQNQVSIGALISLLEQDLATSKGVLEGFLDDIERNPQYFDADKLVFRDVLEALSAQQRQMVGPVH